MQRIAFVTSLLTTTLSAAFRPVPQISYARSATATATATTAAKASSLSSMIDKPFGAWESPVTSKAITAGSVKLGGLRYSNGNVYWLEGRPQDGGRNVLCKHAPDDPKKSERDGVDVSPKESNVRTRVHEYGGGATVMRGKHIYYSEFTTQRLCKLLKEGTSKPITPEGDRYRYADGVLSSNGNVIYCVREDHKNPDPKNVVNEIVAIDVRDGSMKVLATGNDFYSHPRVSPNGQKLAYITWSHPNMPWDSTELRVTSIYKDSSRKSCDHKLIAGGDGDTSVIQPTYQGNRLYYISDQSGYYNIYRAGFEQSILPMNADFGGSAPGYVRFFQNP